MNNATFTVAGVMPASFDFPIDDVEVLLPFWTTTAGIDREQSQLHRRRSIDAGSHAGTSHARSGLDCRRTRTRISGIKCRRSARVEPLKDVLVEDTGIRCSFSR